MADELEKSIDQPQELPEFAEVDSEDPRSETQQESENAASEAPAEQNEIVTKNGEEPSGEMPVTEVVMDAASASDSPGDTGALGASAAKKKAKKKGSEESDGSIGDGPKSDKMDWYILKVQSNREDSISAGLRRRVAIAGLEFYFDKIIVPTEKVTEFKGGKKKVTKRKLYPGYIVVHMEINDDTWFLVRETPGIGDFTGSAGKPTPMEEHEVARIVAKEDEKSDQLPKLSIGFAVGDQVKIGEGTFENFEGQVESIDETSGRVSVMINIFGRSTPVELEHWQLELV